MKKIVLLTDFSKRNVNAEQMALDICGRLGFDLLLLNNYFAIPLVPYSTGGLAAASKSDLYEDAQEELSEELWLIRQEISRMPAGMYRPKVRSLITEGDIGIKVAEIVPRQDIELIVMGAGKGNSFEHLLFGNVVSSVTAHAACPIMVVPQKGTRKKIRKIVLATDFNPQDFNAIDYLAKLSAALGIRIEIVHVQHSSAENDPEGGLEHDLIKKLEEYRHLDIKYTRLIGEEIIDMVNQRCKDSDSDWLAITDHPRDMLMVLFQKNHLHIALRNQNLPILVFPKQLLPAKYFLREVQVVKV